jgi:hypothetical protein
VVGAVYFVLYLLTSYASSNADRVSERFRDLSQAVNVTFGLGTTFLLLAGLAAWTEVRIFSIAVFTGFYLLFNLRRPLTVAFVSDQISHDVMASGLSAESQLKTLLMVVLAPLLGALADRFSVGAALALLGVAMVVVWALVVVRGPAPAAAEAAVTGQRGSQ